MSFNRLRVYITALRYLANFDRFLGESFYVDVATLSTTMSNINITIVML